MKGMIMLMSYFYRINSRRTAAKYLFLGMAIGTVATAFAIKYMDSLNKTIVENFLGQEDGEIEIELTNESLDDNFMGDNEGYIVVNPQTESQSDS